MIDVPQAILKTVEAMVDQALSRCEREGYSQEEFYSILLEEMEKSPGGKLTVAFGRVFERLSLSRN